LKTLKPIDLRHLVTHLLVVRERTPGDVLVELDLALGRDVPDMRRHILNSAVRRGEPGDVAPVSATGESGTAATVANGVFDLAEQPTPDQVVRGLGERDLLYDAVCALDLQVLDAGLSNISCMTS